MSDLKNDISNAVNTVDEHVEMFIFASESFIRTARGKNLGENFKFHEETTGLMIFAFEHCN